MTDNEANLNQPKNKAKTKPEVLVCKHCFTPVKFNCGVFKSHLEKEHNIIGIKPKNARKHFCFECEVHNLKRAMRNKKRKVAVERARKAKAAEKRRVAQEKRKAQIAEYRKKWIGDTPTPIQKDWHCGDVINGGPYVRIMYTPMS